MRFICWACRQDTHRAFRETHHKIPQAAGGTKKDELELCANCHRGLHAVGRKLMSKEGVRHVDEMLHSFSQDQGTQQRILELAQLVVKYTVLKRDGVADKDTRSMRLEIPILVYRGLKTMAQDSNKPIGSFVTELLSGFVTNYFPELRSKHERERNAEVPRQIRGGSS